MNPQHQTRNGASSGVVAPEAQHIGEILPLVLERFGLPGQTAPNRETVASHETVENDAPAFASTA